MLSRRRFLAEVAPASLLAAGCAGLPPAGASPRFAHGVASGDPLADRVILWTRVSGYEGEVELEWQVAASPDFSRVLRRGRVLTGPGTDHTVKVDAAGLEPGTTYYYRFLADDEPSPTGRTRSLPVGRLDGLRLAVISCSNYPAGYFNVYREIGRRNDVDAILHLGDYIYEYPADGYASARAAEMNRLSVPPTELLALGDYRLRHAQYKSDPDLQSAHASAPFIPIWDDHESANDSWRGGAQNHGPGEGDWFARRDRALRAYYEWMPIREPEDRARHEHYRAFEFGDLATLAMIETRHTERSRQLAYARDLPRRQRWFDFSDPQAPRVLDDPATVPAARRRLIDIPYDLRGERPEPILEYERIRSLDPDALPENVAYLPDTERFELEILPDPRRKLLGETQFAWLEESFAASRRAGRRWQVLGNQTIVAEVRAPDLDRALSAQEKARLPGFIRERLPFTRYGLPLNLDAWDGYPAARARLYELFREHTREAIVVTGDTHNAWGNQLADARGRRVGFEFATASVSSPGAAEVLNMPGERFAAMLGEKNPALQYLEMSRRGYLVLTLTRDEAQAEYFFVDTVASPRYRATRDRTLRL